MSFSSLHLKNIAVFRALQLGDVLCAIPALRALRDAFPEARITFIGLPWAALLPERYPSLVDEFMEFPGYPGLPERDTDIAAVPGFFMRAQKRHFDLAVQLHGSGSYVNSIIAMLGARYSAGFSEPGDFCPDPALFTRWPKKGTETERLLALTNFLGLPECGRQLEFPLLAEDHQALSQIPVLNDLKEGGYICLHPGARWPSRRWTPEGFAAVGDAVAADGLRVVLTGAHEEARLTHQVSRLMKAPVANAAGLTSLGALAALLSRARLLICNDTGISHLAAALGVPSVVLGMGSDLARWAPSDGVLHHLMFEPVHCRPCTYRICPLGHECATRLDPQRVIEETRRALCAA
jgi:ADP-heptose:LPS heptosyltransferase